MVSTEKMMKYTAMMKNQRRPMRVAHCRILALKPVNRNSSGMRSPTAKNHFPLPSHSSSPQLAARWLLLVQFRDSL